MQVGNIHIWVKFEFLDIICLGRWNIIEQQQRSGKILAAVSKAGTGT